MASSARQVVTTAPPRAPSRSGDEDLSARLRLVVMRLSRRLRQQAGDDLSPTLISALVTIERNGPLTLGRLAALERVKRPSITRIVAALEKRGLVACEVDPTDRRARQVAVTATARLLLRDSRTRKTAYLARHLRELPKGDVDALAAAVDVLERLLEGDE